MHSPLRIAAATTIFATIAMAGNAGAHGAPAGVFVASPAFAPPVVAAPPVVIAPPPQARYIWQPGYWAWTGYGRTWIEGRWVLAVAPQPVPYYGHHRGWERREWHREPYGPYGPHGAPGWGYR